MADALGDVCGCGRGLAGEVLDLVGDDPEPHAGISGTGGFDGSIEREQVGLSGDLADGRQDPLGLRDRLDEFRNVLGECGRAHEGGLDR